MSADGLRGFSPLFDRIDALCAERERVICAIDGGCAAGKTTLAALLKLRYDCNVFPMDDFFLRPEQRTQERLATPGGNIDYERFNTEILNPLISGGAFAYRPYNCSERTLGAEIRVAPRRLNIVEGVYSMHPHLSKTYDIKVFLDIGAHRQKSRLMQRNKEMYDRFVQEWIPMEDMYFNAFHIKERCDFIFDSETVNQGR